MKDEGGRKIELTAKLVLSECEGTGIAQSARNKMSEMQGRVLNPLFLV
jgi:hypothetical protein